jgi:TolB protein
MAPLLGLRKLALGLSALPLFGCANFAPRTVRHTSDTKPVPPQRPSADLSGPAGIVFFGDPIDDLRPAENRLLTNMTQHTFASVGKDFDPDMHPDGATMVFASTRNSERADIFYKDIDGYTVTQLTADPADDVQPRFSPDGERVVFCSNRTGNWDLWVVSRDGTGLTQLTDQRTDEIAPCWSPDGSQMAFTVWGGRSHQWELWTLDADAPGARRFLAYGMFPDWSPDGRRITFQRARQRGTRWFSVWTIELVDGEARYPTEVAYSDVAACTVPRWSPTGEMIIYCAVRNTGRREPRNADGATAASVWLVDARTGVRSQAVDSGVPAFNPIWGPDGRVMFVSGQGGTENVWSALAPMQPREAVADRGGPDHAPMISQRNHNTRAPQPAD